jgi:alanine-synthesizing transaminase
MNSVFDPDGAPRWSVRSAFPAAETALSAVLRVARAQGAVNLTESNPLRVGLDYSMYGAPATWVAAGPLSYDPDPLGMHSAREALAEACALSADRLVLCSSSSEAYHYLLTLLCDPGDRVLVPEPSYPLFGPIGKYAGVELVPYQLHYDGGWHLDLDSLRRHARARLKPQAILLVSPNNPTGSFVSEAEFHALYEFGIPLIVDEVFRHFPLVGRSSALQEPPVLTFSIDGLSKSAGLPQVKLSWIAVNGPSASVQESLHRLSFITDTYLTLSTPAQAALPHLLRHAPEFRRHLLSRLRHNWDTLRNCLADTSANVLHCEGGWTAIVRLPDVLGTPSDREDLWVRCLAEQHGVLTQPGYFYDLQGGPHIVLSLLPEPQVFADGMQRIVSALAAVLASE